MLASFMGRNDAMTKAHTHEHTHEIDNPALFESFLRISKNVFATKLKTFRILKCRRDKLQNDMLCVALINLEWAFLAHHIRFGLFDKRSQRIHLIRIKVNTQSKISELDLSYSNDINWLHLKTSVLFAIFVVQFKMEHAIHTDKTNIKHSMRHKSVTFHFADNKFSVAAAKGTH